MLLTKSSQVQVVSNLLGPSHGYKDKLTCHNLIYEFVVSHQLGERHDVIRREHIHQNFVKVYNKIGPVPTQVLLICDNEGKVNPNNNIHYKGSSYF